MHYSDFIHFINESNGGGARGFDAKETINRLKLLTKVLPPNIEFGVPADYNGHSTTYKNIQEAIRRIKDLDHSYKSKNRRVNFYCWSITFATSLEAEETLKKKMNEVGQLYHKDQEKYGRYNLVKIAKYFKANPEDADNIKSFTLSIDSVPSTKEAASTPDEIETQVGPQVPTPKPKAPATPPAPLATQEVNASRKYIINYERFLNENEESTKSSPTYNAETMINFLETIIQKSERSIIPWYKAELGDLKRHEYETKEYISILIPVDATGHSSTPIVEESDVNSLKDIEDGEKLKDKDVSFKAWNIEFQNDDLTIKKELKEKDILKDQHINIEKLLEYLEQTNNFANVRGLTVTVVGKTSTDFGNFMRNDFYGQGKYTGD